MCYQNTTIRIQESKLIEELFTRIGPVQSIRLLYDRHDRSEGIAYINYFDIRHAREAIRQFDGANAHDQPIRLTMVPSAPRGPPRSPLDTAPPPSRSLFDRISGPDTRNRRRARSASPTRHSDVTRPAPQGIDRYVPGQRGGRSPIRRRGTPRDIPRDGGRRPGARREPRPRKDDDGHAMVQGRPRKTQEELDAEMADYWGGNGEDAVTENKNFAAPVNGGIGSTNGPAEVTDAIAPIGDDDIDMIE